MDNILMVNGRIGTEKPYPKRKRVEAKVKDIGLIGLRRSQIIEGAVRIFIAKGFRSATVREIADAAGLTMGSLYNYIRTKEDIIYMVYDYITGVLREEMTAAISGIDAPEKRLKAALRHNLKTMHKNQDIIMFLYTESASLGKESLHVVLSRETEYIQLFEDLLRDYFDSLKKEVHEERLRIAADLLAYIPVILSLRRWSLKRRYSSMETVLEDILAFTLSGIEFIPVAERKANKGKGDRPCRNQAKKN